MCGSAPAGYLVAPVAPRLSVPSISCASTYRMIRQEAHRPDPAASRVDPCDAWLRRRRSPLHEASNPLVRRTGEARPEHFGESTDQSPVRCRVDEKPAGRHSIAAKPGEIGCLGDLVAGGSASAPKVIRSIPDLNEDQCAVDVIPQPDVGTSTISQGWPGRELEGAGSALGASQAKDELLTREVSRIRGLADDLEVAREPCGERPTQCRPEREPD